MTEVQIRNVLSSLYMCMSRDCSVLHILLFIFQYAVASAQRQTLILK